MKVDKKKVKKRRDDNVDHDDFANHQDETKKRWFQEIPADPKKFEDVSEQILIELKEEAKKCHDSETTNYNIKNSKTNSDFQWMKTVMAKGTMSDRIAAYTVSIQDSPINNLETIKKLIGMVKVAKKNECVSVMETLTELFIGDLLRPKSELKAFHQRPLSKLNDMSSGNAVTRRKLLSAWYFEEQLKETYSSFVVALTRVAHDTVDNIKEKAITAMYKLLVGNSEQERVLLAQVVNKLGDPSPKVASKAIYCLGQLLFKRQNKQRLVLDEVEKLLFRSNISTRAQYYGLCFLSQFYLSHKTSDVARRVVQVYFAFFKACIKKGDIDSRMMSALLMGVNRAYPYAKLEADKIKEHIDTMYRLVHVASFNVSIHALTLLFQVSDQGEGVADRFYSALYKKILDPHLTATTHQAMVLSLVYKALVKDKDTARAKAFIKRLLQVSLHSQANFTCALLFLISQVMSKKPGLEALVLKQSALNEFDDDKDEEEKYTDAATVADIHTVEINSQIQNTADSAATQTVGSENDVKPDVDAVHASLPVASWYHCTNASKGKKFKPVLRYDPWNRNPLYAGGEHCVYMELTYLKDHSHPTVALYAKNLLEGTQINYAGDPLKDFTIIRFLDRFAFKNPKKLEERKQGAHPTFGKRKVYIPKGVKSLSVNSSMYLNEDQKNIPVDELFMYMYLQKKYADRELKEQEESDVESVQSEEFQNMLNNMTKMKDVDDELDYMNDVESNLQSKKARKKSKGDEEDDMDGDDDDDQSLDEDEDGLDDLEDDFEGDLEDEDLDDMDDFDDDVDDDADSIEFDNSQEDTKGTKGNDKKNKKSLGNVKNKKKNKDDISSLFASADEFATLLEDEGSSNVAPGSSNVYANKDKAGVKQLAWEDKRNRWLQGFDKAVNNRKRKHGGNFGNKKHGQTQFKHKNNKKKRKS